MLSIIGKKYIEVKIKPTFLVEMSPVQNEEIRIISEITNAKNEPPIRFLKKPYSILCCSSKELLTKLKFL